MDDAEMTSEVAMVRATLAVEAMAPKVDTLVMFVKWVVAIVAVSLIAVFISGGLLMLNRVNSDRHDANNKARATAQHLHDTCEGQNTARRAARANAEDQFGVLDLLFPGPKARLYVAQYAAQVRDREQKYQPIITCPPAPK